MTMKNGFTYWIWIFLHEGDYYETLEPWLVLFWTFNWYLNAYTMVLGLRPYFSWDVWMFYLGQMSFTFLVDMCIYIFILCFHMEPFKMHHVMFRFHSLELCGFFLGVWTFLACLSIHMTHKHEFVYSVHGSRKSYFHVIYSLICF